MVEQRLCDNVDKTIYKTSCQLHQRTPQKENPRREEMVNLVSLIFWDNRMWIGTIGNLDWFSETQSPKPWGQWSTHPQLTAPRGGLGMILVFTFFAFLCSCCAVMVTRAFIQDGSWKCFSLFAQESRNGSRVVGIRYCLQVLVVH